MAVDGAVIDIDLLVIGGVHQCVAALDHAGALRQRMQDQEFRDPETGELLNRAALNADLEKIEKPAGISNPKDFRNEIVNFVLRARANNNGRNPSWTSYEKLRRVIEMKMFSSTEDLLPVISYGAKSSADEQRKHDNFVERMMKRGYTEKQVRLLAEWYLRVRKSQ